MKSLGKTGNAADVITITLICAGIAGYVYAHCQIPCGIYDDDARAAMITEHISTVEKSMKKITELSGKENDNNQLVRWIENKEVHADEIAEIITYYFMAQRIKPVDGTDKKAHAEYVKKLTILHKMLIATMKAKQTTDQKHIVEIREQLREFQQTYEGFSPKH